MAMSGLEFISPMKIKCLHGYFIIDEQNASDISRFMSIFAGLEIVNAGEYFTFKPLKGAPRYSIKGNQYLGATATKTVEGEPWEVMRANGLVYNFAKGLVQPKSAITQSVQLTIGAGIILSPGLILPGSRTNGGVSVTDYAARYSFGTGRFIYSEVSGG